MTQELFETKENFVRGEEAAPERHFWRATLDARAPEANS